MFTTPASPQMPLRCYPDTCNFYPALNLDTAARLSHSPAAAYFYLSPYVRVVRDQQIYFLFAIS